MRANRNARIAMLAAGGLLKGFLAEIAPVVYDQGVADAQARMQLRVAELNIDVNSAAFPDWNPRPPTRRTSRGRSPIP